MQWYDDANVCGSKQAGAKPEAKPEAKPSKPKKE
jgi:hypothetical protein